MSLKKSRSDKTGKIKYQKRERRKAGDAKIEIKKILKDNKNMTSQHRNKDQIGNIVCSRRNERWKDVLVLSEFKY